VLTGFDSGTRRFSCWQLVAVSRHLPVYRRKPRRL